MIQKLESAGLGYHVRADETEERLGRIPLRHLVYRVHALPESMRSLVWDFGQLNPEVEELYTRQIVRRYVGRGRLPGDDRLVNAIATVLATSQQFMRNKKDECSFVSLRDVKRAMQVMVWFYENFNNFSPLIHDEDGDGDVKADHDDDENKDEEEFKEEHPRHREQRPIIEEELFFREDERFALQKESPSFTEQRPVIEEDLFSREDERPAVQKESPFFSEGPLAFKERSSPLTEEYMSTSKAERLHFKEAVSSSKKERPSVRRFAFKPERQPTLPQARSTLEELKEEHPRHREQRPIIEELFSRFLQKESPSFSGQRPIIAEDYREDERPAVQKESPSFSEGPLAFKKRSSLAEEYRSSKEERPSVRKQRFAFKPEGQPTLIPAQSPLEEERQTIKEEHSVLKNVLSAAEKRSPLKGKRPTLKDGRSPRRAVRPTSRDEHPSLEKEGPSHFEACRPSVHFADPKETMPPKESDLQQLPQEIFGTTSQVEHLFFLNRSLN